MAQSGRIEGSRLPRTWESFVVWVVVGMAVTTCFFLVGTLALLPILFIVWMGRRPSFRRSWFGVMTGVGVMLLYVGYSQRKGPGWVCWHTSTAAGCDQYMTPWPWLVAGVVLVAMGVIAQARRMRALP